MVVYHDDNAGGIPHAHVVVNNTNLSNWRRLQDPDPRALKHSIQHLAQVRGMRYLKDLPKAEQKLQAPSLQNEYTRRAEVQLCSEGKYSWVADIRSRVKVARSVAHSETEFRNLLDELGVQVSDNSTKAARADWIYSLTDVPTRRVSGEKFGLAYGRESLLNRFEGSLKDTLPRAYEERLADIARHAVVVGNLAQLQRLSDAVTLIERGQIKNSVALDVFMRRPYERMAWNDLTQEKATSASEFIHQKKMLPFRTPGKPSRTPITEDIGPVGVPVSHRRDGWSVLLADSRDMAHLRRVSVDGETVLVRTEGELVDVQVLEYAADIASYYTPRIVGAYDYYLKALGKTDSPVIDEEICSMLSASSRVMQELIIRQELCSG